MHKNACESYCRVILELLPETLLRTSTAFPMSDSDNVGADEGPTKGETIRERIEVLEFSMHALHGYCAKTWGNMIDRLKSLEQAVLKDFRSRGSIEARVAALEEALKPQTPQRSMKERPLLASYGHASLCDGRTFAFAGLFSHGTATCGRT